MAIAPTYPGLYIQELPSSTHTITAAPTSIAVIVGYTHPLQTVTPNKPVELFSFNDYQVNFGGFFANQSYFGFGTSPSFSGPSDNFGSVAHAVNQFFLNGGSICHVVGLIPQALQSAQVPTYTLTPNPSASGQGIVFTARQPMDCKNFLSLTINNLQSSSSAGSSPCDTADITITYGTGAGSIYEKYRGVSLNPGPANQPNPNFIETVIGTPKVPVSSLVTITPISANTGYPTYFAVSKPSNGILVQPGSGTNFSPQYYPPQNSPIFAESDFTAVFQANSPLDKLPIFNLLLLPGVTNNGILSLASAFCEQKLAFLIIDPPPPDQCSADGTDGLPSVDQIVLGNANPEQAPPLEKNCALYFPYIQSTDPVTGNPINLPPSGTVAGIFANEDLQYGVWKAPAGLETVITNTTGVVTNGQMSNQRQGVLNQVGVNCLRDFTGVGTVVFGARTLVTQNPSLSQLWRYVNVRRMALFLEQTLLTNLTWVVFQSNAEPLWNAIRTSISSFMLGLFRQQAFQGTTPSEAYQVKCDSTTTSQDDIDNGIVNILVAFAPLKPAEFVIIQIAQLAGQTQTS